MQDKEKRGRVLGQKAGASKQTCNSRLEPRRARGRAAAHHTHRRRRRFRLLRLRVGADACLLHAMQAETLAQDADGIRFLRRGAGEQVVQLGVPRVSSGSR